MGSNSSKSLQSLSNIDRNCEDVCETVHICMSESDHDVDCCNPEHDWVAVIDDVVVLTEGKCCWCVLKSTTLKLLHCVTKSKHCYFQWKLGVSSFSPNMDFQTLKPPRPEVWPTTDRAMGLEYIYCCSQIVVTVMNYLLTIEANQQCDLRCLTEFSIAEGHAKRLITVLIEIYEQQELQIPIYQHDFNPDTMQQKADKWLSEHGEFKKRMEKNLHSGTVNVAFCDAVLVGVMQELFSQAKKESQCLCHYRPCPVECEE